MNVRLCLFFGLLGVGVAGAWLVGCGRASPTTPTGSNIVSATINGGNLLTAIGQTTQLSLIGHAADGSTQDLTSRAVWTSDSPAIVTITAQGVATAVSFGTARITASIPSMPAVAAPIQFAITVSDTQNLQGQYQLTFQASTSCHLSPEAMRRTYMATITPISGGLRVTLSGANFWTQEPRGLEWNTFTLEPSDGGYLIHIADIDVAFYYGGGIAELLAPNEYVAFYGSGTVQPLTPSFAATFAGTVSILAPPLVGDTYGLIATCAAADHQLVFTRTSNLSAVRQSAPNRKGPR